MWRKRGEELRGLREEEYERGCQGREEEGFFLLLQSHEHKLTRRKLSFIPHFISINYQTRHRAHGSISASLIKHVEQK